MKIVFTKNCKDKYTGDRYKAGQEKVFKKERAEEIIAKGFAEEVRKDDNDTKEEEHADD